MVVSRSRAETADGAGAVTGTGAGAITASFGASFGGAGAGGPARFSKSSILACNFSTNSRSSDTCRLRSAVDSCALQNAAVRKKTTNLLMGSGYPTRYSKGMNFRRAALALILAVAGMDAARPAAKPKKAPLTPEERAAQSILKSLSLRDRIAQMIIGTCYGEAPGMKTPEYQKYRHWVKDLRIGGLIVANRIDHGAIRNAEPPALALFLTQMQKLAKTPLLAAADLERGASMRVSGGAQFPYNMAYGAG